MDSGLLRRLASVDDPQGVRSIPLGKTIRLYLAEGDAAFAKISLGEAGSRRVQVL